MSRRSERGYERVERYPLGRAPFSSYDDEPSQVRRTPMLGSDFRSASFDDFDAPAGVPRSRLRQVAWRLVGAAAIGGAFYGIAQIGVYPEARREIAQWVTLGHPDRLTGVGQTIEKWVGRVRHW